MAMAIALAIAMSMAMALAMDKKTFIQNFVIQRTKTLPAEAISDAVTAYDSIEALFPKFAKDSKEGFQTAKGRYITDHRLAWFDAIWTVWNVGISTGTKGGKKQAGDAFLDQIKNKNDAKMAYASAREHAEKERPALEAKGSTPPYFNKWFNDGRWDTKLIVSDEFEMDRPPPVSKEVIDLRCGIHECDNIIKQFGGYGATEGNTNIIKQAKERKEDLTAKLMQASRNETV